ncbi:MAG: sigma factor-like helix-turn-helix DNA-binding protein [Smithella sp.]|nr:sigma factor-like helix-turn-helix DNA-binding protein [Smithella sp.]
MAKPRSKAQAERDRQLISKYYLEGMTQWEIKKKMGISQATVSRDIAILIRYWRLSQLQNIDSAKQIELAKINKLEIEYWNSWDRSKEEFKKKSLKQRVIAESKQPIEINSATEDRNGDPRYLAGVQWCITKRCEILGINAAIKTETNLTGTLTFADLVKSINEPK